MSDHSVLSSGNGSWLLGTPSPSLSASLLSPTPSPSRSDHSEASFGKASLWSGTPSPSVSTTPALEASSSVLWHPTFIFQQHHAFLRSDQPFSQLSSPEAQSNLQP